MTDSELTPGNEYEGFVEKTGPNRLLTVRLDAGPRIQARITPRIGMLPGNLDGWRVRVLMRKAPKPATVRRVFRVET
jgi:translation initiation factor IF-1